LQKLTIRICDIAIHVTVKDARLLAAARKRYAAFQSNAPADLSLEVSVTDLPLGPDQDEPRVRRKGSAVHVLRHDVELDLDSGAGRATILRGARHLDSLVRIALSFELAKRGGFLCHSAGVGGWLFPGLSGAGKSTLGRAVPRDRLLADELVGVVGRRLWGTPFRGDFLPGRNPASHPLEAIVLLDRLGPRGVRPVPKVTALVRLLQCALHFGEDPESAQAVLDSARRCVLGARTFALSYDARRTGFPDVERQIRKALRGS
jgi:hypothetical protein